MLDKTSHNEISHKDHCTNNLVHEAFGRDCIKTMNRLLNGGAKILEGGIDEIKNNPGKLATEVGISAATVFAIEAAGLSTAAVLGIAAIPIGAYGAYKAYEIAKKEGVGAIPKHLKQSYNSLQSTITNTFETQMHPEHFNKAQKDLADQRLHQLGAGSTVFAAALLGGPVKDITKVAVSKAVNFGDMAATRAWQQINGWVLPNGLRLCPEYATASAAGNQIASNFATKEASHLSGGIAVGSGSNILHMSAYESGNGRLPSTGRIEHTNDRSPTPRPAEVAGQAAIKAELPAIEEDTANKFIKMVVDGSYINHRQVHNFLNLIQRPGTCSSAQYGYNFTNLVSRGEKTESAFIKVLNQIGQETPGLENASSEQVLAAIPSMSNVRETICVLNEFGFRSNIGNTFQMGLCRGRSPAQAFEEALTVIVNKEF